MAKNVNFLRFDGDLLKLDRDKLNKEVFYPIIKKGYDVAKINAATHRKTGQLLKNLKTVSLANKSNDSVGYILYAGRRSDYSDAAPHFIVYYTYQNGKMYRAIKRAVSSEVRKLS